MAEEIPCDKHQPHLLSCSNMCAADQCWQQTRCLEGKQERDSVLKWSFFLSLIVFIGKTGKEQLRKKLFIQFFLPILLYSLLFPPGKSRRSYRTLGRKLKEWCGRGGRMADLPRSLLVNSENCTETLYVFSFRKFRLDPSVVRNVQRLMVEFKVKTEPNVVKSELSLLHSLHIKEFGRQRRLRGLREVNLLIQFSDPT